jgi:hypothetical protein
MNNAPAAQHLIFGDEGLAKYLNVRPTSPTGWRKSGWGPPFIRVGPRRVAYRVADVEAWLAARENMPVLVPATPRPSATFAADIAAPGECSA